jgi:hypothetical protein
MPFIPRSLVVLVNDPADGNKWAMVVYAFGPDLNWRTIRWKVGDLADLLQVHISADEDGFAVFADSLNAA